MGVNKKEDLKCPKCGSKNYRSLFAGIPPEQQMSSFLNPMKCNVCGEMFEGCLTYPIRFTGGVSFPEDFIRPQDIYVPIKKKVKCPKCSHEFEV